MAEAIFKSLANQDGLAECFEVTSAGTKDWDIGLRPDHRTQRQLSEHGYPLDPNKRARKIMQSEIANADYLIVMSRRVAGEIGERPNVFLLMDFVEGMEGNDVPDPYPNNTFPQAFNLIQRGVTAFYGNLKGKLRNQ